MIELNNREFVEIILNRILKTRGDVDSIMFVISIGQGFSIEFDRVFSRELCNILTLIGMLKKKIKY